MKLLMTIGLAGALGLGAAILAPQEASADNGSTWDQLPFAGDVLVTGWHYHPDMEWDNTFHKITLANGRKKTDTWYDKKLGSRIFEELRPDGTMKVRYDARNNNGPDITKIVVKLKNAANSTLCRSVHKTGL